MLLPSRGSLCSVSAVLGLGSLHLWGKTCPGAGGTSGDLQADPEVQHKALTAPKQTQSATAGESRNC